MIDFVNSRAQLFFDSVSSVDAAYLFKSFSFVAVNSVNGWVIVKGTVSFNTGQPEASISPFTTTNVIARRYTLAELGKTEREIFDSLTAGQIETPDGILLFPPVVGGNHAIWYSALHSAGITQQQRIGVLQLSGSNYAAFVDRDEVDWQLKAADMPFDTMQELFNTFGLGQITGQINIEFVAFHVAVADYSSKVEGDKAWPTIKIASGLEKNKIKVGYRVFDGGQIVDRGSVRGEKLTWLEDQEPRLAKFELTIPVGAAIHCIVSYDNVAQNYGWLADPATHINVRRGIYDAFDPKLSVIKELVAKAVRKGDDAHNFEAAISWVLWMLGFAVAFLGGTKKNQDAPDIIATAPNGNVLVIECTTGLLKAENKLAQLYDRTQLVRKAMDVSRGQHLQVLPVIVTSKPRSEVEADIEQAERLGVLVICREEIEAEYDRTLLPGNADQLFSDAVQHVEKARQQRDTRFIDGGSF